MSPTHQQLVSGQPRVLVVEDDPEIADLVQWHLREALCAVDHAADGASALAKALTLEYDVLLLDISLPDLDGLALCRILRQRGVTTPIMLLTARNAEMDKVQGLEVGADDYMTKPFSLPELYARIKALVRRGHVYAGPPKAARHLSFGELHIDVDRRQVTRAATAIELTAKEFDLLLCLAQQPGHVFTRDGLLTAVWGYHYEGYAHTVNSHINRLRAKIEHDPAAPQFILTVWSVGYRFRDA